MEVIKDDYIRKIEAVKILQKAYAEGRIKAKDGCVSVLDDINALPAADVQPVKHGYWEEVTDYGGWGDTHYRCSVCGEEWYLEDGKPKDNNMNFCPRCGSRMEGDTE
jgi:DNA-directed RNA polymerase subunit RPC12/RpoP